LNVTEVSRSNTYGFKWNEKKIVLKPVKFKSNVGSNKMEVVIDKKSEKPCYLVTRSQSSLKTLVDRFTSKPRNPLGLLPLPIDIKPIVTLKSPVSRLHELHVHTKRQMTFNDYNYQSIAEFHKQL